MAEVFCAVGWCRCELIFCDGWKVGASAAFGCFEARYDMQRSLHCLKLP